MKWIKSFDLADRALRKSFARTVCARITRVTLRNLKYIMSIKGIHEFSLKGLVDYFKNIVIHL